MEKQYCKKIGRPQKGIKKRGHQVNSSYNDMEYRLLRGKAEIANLTLSECQRQCALTGRARGVFSREQNLCLVSIFNMEKSIRTLIKECRELQRCTFNNLVGFEEGIVNLLREWNSVKKHILKEFGDNYDC